MKYLLAAAMCWTLLITAAVAEESPIIPPDALVEVVSTGGYLFTEGPALAPDGSIYFSDIPNNSIHRYDPATGETTLFTNDSGGANGLMFAEGRLYACAGKARTLRLYGPVTEPRTDKWIGIGKTHRPLDNGPFRLYQDQPYNSPNDVAYLPASNQQSSGFLGADAVYFTDPRYGNRDGMKQSVEGVYSISVHKLEGSDLKKHLEIMEAIGEEPIAEPAALFSTRIIDDLVRPNGIGVSPDGQMLYVNDNGDEKIWAYPILEPGKVGEGRLLNDLADLGGPDGMTVGPLGRVYTTIYGKGVLILSPEGERLGFLETGPQTTNCVFGADGKTLYVTADKSLKRVVLNTGIE